MSITLNGRIISCILKQNTGTTTNDGTELDISSYLTSLGEVSWTVDENLTKLSLGSLSLTTTDDEASTVYTFCKNSLTSTSGLLPPWIILTVDGVQKFIGIVKEPPSKSEDAGSLELSFSAVDWSSMLESSRIKDDGTFSRIVDFTNGSGTWNSNSSTVNCYSVQNFELRKGQNRNMIAVALSEASNYNVGDWVYFANYSTYLFNKSYLIQGIKTLTLNGLGSVLCLYLGSDFRWIEAPGDVSTNRQLSTVYRCHKATGITGTVAELPKFKANEYFTYLETDPKKTTIKLDGVAGLMPGDILDKTRDYFYNPTDPDSSFSVGIIDIDVANSTVTIDQPLKDNLLLGNTTFQLNRDSLNESVLVPLRSLVDKSVLGLASVDYSSYNSAVLPSPCFGFISPRSPSSQNTHTEALSGITDIQTSLNAFQAVGTNGAAWTGDPSTGWDVLTPWVKSITWTDQVSSAPAYVMPSVALPGDADTKAELIRCRTRYPGLRGYADDPNIDVDRYQAINYKIVYDYSNMRRYAFRYQGKNLTLAVTTYNGSSWSTVSGFSTTGIGTTVAIAPLAGTSSSVGSGLGLLALCRDGSIKTILSTVALTATLAGNDVFDATGTLQVNLRQTPNGLYYMTPSGYGRIWINGGALTSKWTQIIDTTSNSQKITPITSTFCYANGRIITLAKVSFKATEKDDTFTEDTYLFQLNPDIQAKAIDCVYSADRICQNIPRSTMAIKSPSSNAIFGLMGSRLFQIDYKLPETVERFNPINQTAQSIIEYICTITNTIAIPMVTGKIKLVTRGVNTTPVNVTVDVVSRTETRWNKHLCDCIVVKGKDCKGIAVSTTQLAGLTVSLSNEVYIRNSSQAKAIAQAYLAFFEKPRYERSETWYSDTTPAPWEALEPMQVITINGGSTQYYLTGLSHNLDTKTATANLLQVV